MNEQELQKIADKIMTKGRARDVQLHLGAYIAPRVNNVEVIGEKDKEIFYQAIQYDAKELPVKESDVQASFTKFYNLLIKDMRRAGLIR